MSSSDISSIPSHRRDLLFAEISRKVNEVEAIDRSLEGIGEGMAIDEALEEIVDLLAGEVKKAVMRKRRQERGRGRQDESRARQQCVAAG